MVPLLLAVPHSGSSGGRLSLHLKCLDRSVADDGYWKLGPWWRCATKINNRNIAGGLCGAWSWVRRRRVDIEQITHLKTTTASYLRECRCIARLYMSSLLARRSLKKKHFLFDLLLFFFFLIHSISFLFSSQWSCLDTRANEFGTEEVRIYREWHTQIFISINLDISRIENFHFALKHALRHDTILLAYICVFVWMNVYRCVRLFCMIRAEWRYGAGGVGDGGWFLGVGG